MGERQFVVFNLGSEEYGIDITNVQEIILPPQTTILPNSPSHVVGIINLRNSIIPIIDLKKRFGLDGTAGNGEARVIILKAEGRSYGIIVDNVQEVLRLNSDQIEQGEDVYHDIDKSFVSGIAKLDQRLIIILQMQSDI